MRGRREDAARAAPWTLQEVSRSGPIGSIDIEVGYHVRRSPQGRGYATEAAAATRAYARDDLGVGRLIAIIHPDNVASQRVAQKIGLTLEQEIDRHGRRTRICAGLMRAEVDPAERAP